MSLIATHLRFALVIKDDLGAGDLEKYIAGAVYPDTRYTTGLARRLTHDFGHFATRRAFDDFEKGWLAHLIGDRVFGEVAEDRFPDLVLSGEIEDRWAVIAALKIIQDIEDAGRLDLPAALAALDYYELPHQEDERRVIRFHDILRETYGGHQKLTAADYLPMWKGLGMDERKRRVLEKRLREFYADEGLIKRIAEEFAEGMDLYREKYRASVRARDFAALSSPSSRPA